MRAEILFPHKSVSSLANLRDQKWHDLVKHVATLPEDDPESLAFCLTMIRQCGCLDCNPDRYKALMGCSACAKRNVIGFKGSDDALIRSFRQARKDVSAYLEDTQLAEAA
jgi:hypothetical protein